MEKTNFFNHVFCDQFNDIFVILFHPDYIKNGISNDYKELIDYIEHLIYNNDIMDIEYRTNNEVENIEVFVNYDEKNNQVKVNIAIMDLLKDSISTIKNKILLKMKMLYKKYMKEENVEMITKEEMFYTIKKYIKENYQDFVECLKSNDGGFNSYFEDEDAFFSLYDYYMNDDGLFHQEAEMV